jgi:hypothetical protein
MITPEQRQHRSASGLCSQCGRYPHEPGRKRCACCAKRTRDSARRIHKRTPWTPGGMGRPIA